MKRRHFLQHSFSTALGAALFNGIPVATMANSPLLNALLDSASSNDHVLVVIQLNGGNDGLNTVVPIDKYSLYQNARSNIAIAEDKLLRLTGIDTLGLNPAMVGMQALYNEGKIRIVQSVSYPSPSFSHFRATDIWTTASNSNEYLISGWAGRFLANQYPDFPNTYPNSSMPDPLAIQIGSSVSPAFQGPTAAMAMSITNPTTFFSLLQNKPQDLPDTPAGKELGFLRQLSAQTSAYSDVIKAAAAKITQQYSGYPAANTNKLADQLKIVAQLIGGGLQTKIYWVNLSGFDTHSNQVVSSDTSTGTHAKLWSQVSESIRVFMEDLKFLGVSNRVIGMTFSEFGRRIKSNSSLGTDHGVAAPVFLFGNAVQGGVSGVTPSIPASPTSNDNIAMQFDFRSVYATILERWFCLDPTLLSSVLLRDYQVLPLIQDSACGTVKVVVPKDDQLVISNFPNPMVDFTTFDFKTEGGQTLLQIVDNTGRIIDTLVDRSYESASRESIIWNAMYIPKGVYFARYINNNRQQVCKVLKN